MSMWLSMVRVSKEAFEAIQKDPALLKKVFFEPGALDELAIEEDDRCGVDYLLMSEAYVEMAAATGDEIDEEDILGEDLGPTKTLDFDAGYGPAFYLDPEQVKRAAKQSMIPEMDDEAQRVFAAATKKKSYLIGVIS